MTSRSTALAFGTTFALALAPLAAVAQEAGVVSGQPARFVEVAGEGMAQVAPDMAMISLGVTHQAPTAAEAMALIGDGSAGVLAAFSAEGVAPADIRTGQLMLSPSYDYNQTDAAGMPFMNGFIATQMYDVRIRDLEALSGILDVVVAQGANQFNGVTFDVADATAARDAARVDALADAADRAAVFAEAAGLTLGPILSVSETPGMSMPLPYYDARGGAEASGTIPIAGGELTVTSVVMVTYAVE